MEDQQANQPVETSSPAPRRRRSERYAKENQTPVAAPAAPETQQPEPVKEAAPVVTEPQATATKSVQRVAPTRIDTPAETNRTPIVPTPGVPGTPNYARDGARPVVDLPVRSTVRRPAKVEGFAPVEPLNPHEKASRANLDIDQRDSEQQRAALQRQLSEPAVPNWDETEEQKKGGSRVLSALICVVIVLGLLVAGVMLIPEDATGFLGSVRSAVTGLLGGSANHEDPVTLNSFSGSIQQKTAPYQVAFTLDTSSNVTDVRLVDAQGQPFDTDITGHIPNTASTLWTCTITLQTSYVGEIHAQLYSNGAWVDAAERPFQLEVGTNAMPNLSVVPNNPSPNTNAPAGLTADPLTADSTSEPTVSPAIATDAAASEPTAIPTNKPAEETVIPTAEPAYSPTPTLSITATPTLKPTATPTAPAQADTAAPSAEPEETLPPEQPLVIGETERPTEKLPMPTPTNTPVPERIIEAVEEADPKLIADTVVYQGSSKSRVTEYIRSGKQIVMPFGDQYIPNDKETGKPREIGVLTFRNNAFRQNAAEGTVKQATKMTELWRVEAGSLKMSGKTYYGFGWTNQPLIVEWSNEIRKAMDLDEKKKADKKLREVIMAGQDGKVYFLDLADGTPTRAAYNISFPMRATPSVNSLTYPQLVLGQYARKQANGKYGDIGLRFYDLNTNKRILFVDGLDGTKNRPYNGVGAFDTSPLYDRNSDTYITAGTNGMLYIIDMNTKVYKPTYTMETKPELTMMKSRTKNQKDAYTAVESSLAMYANYAYYADMDGILRCVELNTLTTVWAVDTGDAVRATISLELDEDDNLWLYTCNTLYNRSKGDVTIRRYNAANGQEDWAFALNAQKPKNDTVPGAMASPVVGEKGLDKYVYFTLSNLSKKGSETLEGKGANQLAGVLIALEKATGKVAWTYDLDGYCYSSPVAVYDEEGRGWIIQATKDGVLLLLDGVTGEKISDLALNGTIEASPAVFNDILVIGTTGKNTSYIYAVKIE